MSINQLPLLLVLLTVFAACQPPNDTLSSIDVRILDENKHPTPVRVRFTNLEGQYFAPDGHQADFPITQASVPESEEQDLIMDGERRFAYVEGVFSIKLPPGQIRMEILKGFRYKIYDDTLNLAETEGRLEIQLEKWVELPEDNWYSGDVHVHFLNPGSALLETKAEDLNVCNVLISDFTSDLDRFRGLPEPISEPGHIIYYGQEFRENRLGHINLLNLKDRLIEPAKEQRQHQYPLNMYAMDEAHKNQGHVSWAHFAAWPGLEGPLAAVLRKVDAVELLCTIDPFHEPIFASDVVPEVQMNSGLRLWYRLLNCGLNIPATAGTDKMNNQVSVGANRVYAQVEGDLTYDAWIKALNEGKTFISNSPFLFCKVDGQGPGSLVKASDKESYTIKAEVWSQLPIDRLEIIANGELLAEKAIVSGQTHAQLEIAYQTDKSVWIAAQAYQFSREATRRGLSLAQRRDAGGGPTLFNQYFGTLRPETVFAHTSPVYLLVDNQPIKSPNDAAYFVHYLDNAIEWLEDAGSFPSEEAKREVLAAFREGKQAFEELGLE